MADPGAADLYRLAARLREAGKEGQGLRRDLFKAIEDAAKPIADKISSLEHLEPYLPNRYAVILAGDLKVSASKSFSGDPRVRLVAKGRQHKRKVVLLNDGFINHPVYPRGPRRLWHWQNRQTGGMRPGFFTQAAEEARPEVRDRVMAALTETVRKITA